MTAMPTISRLDAALELERRGLPLPDSARAMLNMARQRGEIATPGIDAPGMTVRTAVPSLPIPGGSVSVPRGTPMTRQTFESAPEPTWLPERAPTPSPTAVGFGDVRMAEYQQEINVPPPPGQYQDQVLTRPTQDPDEMEVARELAAQKQANLPFWRRLTWPEKLAHARDAVNRRKNPGGFMSQAHSQVPMPGGGYRPAVDQLEFQAADAAARQAALREGTFRYQTAAQAEQDRLILQQHAEKRRQEGVAARAQQLGAFGTAALSAADTASFGLGAIARNQISPEMQGLETAAAQQSPVGALVGGVAGSLVPGAAAGRVGGAAARGLAGRMGGGAVAQAVATPFGNIAGGALTLAPMSFGQQIGQGASVGEAATVAGQQLIATPVALHKAATGQELTTEDRMALAFSLMNFLGISGDIDAVVRAMDTATPNGAAYARVVAQTLQQAQPAAGRPAAQEWSQGYKPTEDGGNVIQIDPALQREPIRQTPRSYGAEPNEIAARDRAAAEAEMQADVAAAEVMAGGGSLPARQAAAFRQEAQAIKRGIANELQGEQVASGTSDIGIPYVIESLPDGRFRWVNTDEQGNPLERGFANTLEEAQAAVSQPVAPLEQPISPRGLGTDIGIKMAESFRAPRPRVGEEARGRRQEKPVEVARDDVAMMGAELNARSRAGTSAEAEIDTIRGAMDNIDDQGGPYVMIDLPVEGDYMLPGGARPEMVQQYGALSPETAPPIIAGPLAGSNQILIADGKTRLMAARQRGDKTVKALVPKSWADQRTPKAEAGPEEVVAPAEPEPAAPGDIPGAKYNGPQLDDEGNKLFDIYTDDETGTSFSVMDDQDPAQVLAQTRQTWAEARAKKAQREQPVTTEEPAAPVEAGPAEEFELPKKPSVEQRLDDRANKLLKDGKKKDIKWSEVSDAELLRMQQIAGENHPLTGKIAQQIRSRGMTDTGDFAARRSAYAQEIKNLPQIDDLKNQIGDWPDDIVQDLATTKKHGPVSKIVRAEARRRGLEFPGSNRPDATPATVDATPEDAFINRQTTETKAAAHIADRLDKVAQGRAIRDPNSPQQMIAGLARSLGLGGVGIGQSRLLKKMALGFYRTTPESIRQRMNDMLEVYAHEVGHHIHKALLQGGKLVSKKQGGSPTGLTDAVFPQAWHAELDRGGRALYGNQKPTSGYLAEGWAEFSRLMMTDEVRAMAEYPTVYPEAIRLLQNDWPEQYSAIEQFRNRYQLYEQSSPVVKAAGYIRRHSRPDKENWEWYDRMRVALFDRMQPLVRMKKDLGIGEGELPADRDPEIVARRAFGRASGDMKRAMHYGRFDPGDPNVTLGPSLEAILSPIKNYLPEFELYLTLRRTAEKRSQGHQGILSRLTTTDIGAAINQLDDQFPKFADAADEFQKFNEWLIRDYATFHGMISHDTAEKIISKNLHYITFNQVKADAPERIAKGGTARFVDTPTGINKLPKNLMGNQIEPPLEQFMSHMQMVMNNAQMNRVGVVLTEMFNKDPRGGNRGIDGMGRWIDKVDRPVEAVKIGGEDVLEQVMRRIKQSGIDPATIDPDTLMALGQLIAQQDFIRFKPGFKVDKSTRQFTVLKGGKPQYWQVKNDMLYEFLEGFTSPESVQSFWRLLSLPRRVYRAGATALNPEFFLINFFRDLISGAVFTSSGRAGVKKRVNRNIARQRAVWRAFTSGDPGAAFLASGADMAGLFGEYVDPVKKTFDPNALFGKKHNILQAASDQEYRKLAREVLKSPFDLIAAVNERFELANRLAEFEATLADARFEGKSVTREVVERAGQAAADITLDFQRGGTVSLHMNQYIPFFNAAFIGGDKLAREIKKNPMQMVGRTFTFVVAPSLAAAYMNKDNPDYYNIPMETRDRYWHIPVYDPDSDGRTEWLRLPKPYGLGAFSILAERAVNSMYGIDPITGKRGDEGAWRGAAKSVADQFRPPYHVPIVTPLLELITNHSLFFGGPIIQKSEQMGPPAERGSERSSSFAVAMAGLMQDTFGVSPPQIDYAVQGLFAGLGKGTVDFIIDPILNASNENLRERVRRTKTPSQPEFWPIIRRILVEEPKTFSETAIRWWQTWDSMENAYRGFTNRQKIRDPKISEYVAANDARIRAYNNLRPFKNALDKQFQALRALYRDRTLSESDRRAKQSELYDSIRRTMTDGLNSLTRTKERKP